jgi:hypothetical protein
MFNFAPAFTKESIKLWQKNFDEVSRSRVEELPRDLREVIESLSEVEQELGHLQRRLCLMRHWLMVGLGAKDGEENPPFEAQNTEK